MFYVGFENGFVKFSHIHSAIYGVYIRTCFAAVVARASLFEPRGFADRLASLDAYIYKYTHVIDIYLVFDFSCCAFARFFFSLSAFYREKYSLCDSKLDKLSIGALILSTADAKLRKLVYIAGVSKI